jgi:hypothetical protein
MVFRQRRVRLILDSKVVLVLVLPLQEEPRE